MALETHLILADELNDFEKDYLSAMVKKRDELWENMKDFSHTNEAAKKYDELNCKVIFLQGMLKNMRAVSSGDAVIVDRAQKFIQAFDGGKVTEISRTLTRLKEVVL